MTRSKKRMTAALLGVLGLALVAGSKASVLARAVQPARPGTIFANLAGPGIGTPPIAPFGHARYRERAGVRDFFFEMAAVNLPNGTLIHCLVNGNPVMAVPLTAGVARPAAILSTATGDAVPFVHAGDVVTVTADGVGAIATGIFQ